METLPDALPARLPGKYFQPKRNQDSPEPPRLSLQTLPVRRATYGSDYVREVSGVFRLHENLVNIPSAVIGADAGRRVGADVGEGISAVPLLTPSGDRVR